MIYVILLGTILALMPVVNMAGCGGGSSSDAESLTDDPGDVDIIDISGYAIVDTGQLTCYDDVGDEITCPAPGESFYGQDAQYLVNKPYYTDNGNGTVTDNVPGQKRRRRHRCR